MAFCLWAAEWWHRNYEEGPWSWRPLLAELGRVDFAPGEPRYFELQSVVARGLEAWNRRVLRVGSTRAFLSTLACEGGLPMKVILRGHTPLRSYFRGVLEEYRLFGSAGIPPSELAERVRDRLPKAWRQDVVYQLSGELIAEVWRLQRELGDTETPVRDLDRRRPTWRDGLPLRVTDDVARTLLNGLLLDAAEVARGGRIRVRWTVELVPVDENLWELKGVFRPSCDHRGGVGPSPVRWRPRRRVAASLRSGCPDPSPALCSSCVGDSVAHSRSRPFLRS